MPTNCNSLIKTQKPKVTQTNLTFKSPLNCTAIKHPSPKNKQEKDSKILSQPIGQNGRGEQLTSSDKKLLTLNEETKRKV